MSKYVIYNPDDDTYLNCGPSIHNISDNDTYVEDVNDATLFNTLSEIWELLTDFEYIRTIEPVVLKVAVDVIPDHTIDHYLIKKETDEAMIENALESDALNEEAKEFLKDFIASLGEKKLFTHRDIQRIQNAIDKETHCRNDRHRQSREDIFEDEYISETKRKMREEKRNVFNPSDSKYI